MITGLPNLRNRLCTNKYLQQPISFSILMQIKSGRIACDSFSQLPVDTQPLTAANRLLKKL